MEIAKFFKRHTLVTISAEQRILVLAIEPPPHKSYWRRVIKAIFGI